MSSEPISIIPVSFSEYTAVSPDQASGNDFDITIEGGISPNAYCTALIEKCLTLHQSDFPKFLDHHCMLVKSPFNWLNRFEKLLAENEDLFVQKKNRSRFTKLYTLLEFKRDKIKSSDQLSSKRYRPVDRFNGYSFDREYSFRKTKELSDNLTAFEEKILFLEEQIIEYEQNPPHVVNRLEQDFVKQCQLEISKLTRQHELNQKVRQKQLSDAVPVKKLQVNFETKSWVHIFYQLMHLKGEDGSSGLKGNASEIAQHICDCYLQMDGTPFNFQTVRTYLSKGDTDGRPKQDKEINLDL